MKVVLVLPSFNAARTLRRRWETIPKDCADEIILVDDAHTNAAIAAAEGVEGLPVIRHPEIRSYGAHQETYYTKALKRRSDIVMMPHQDFQYDPSRVPHMIKPIAKVAIPVRYLSSSSSISFTQSVRYGASTLLTLFP